MQRFQLLEDEKILIEEPIHWKNYILPFTGIVATVYLMITRLINPDFSITNAVVGEQVISGDVQGLLTKIEALILALFTALLYLRVLQTMYIRYYITTKRIISVSGILTVMFQEMLISRCEMVYLNQSVTERLFESGDILCVSAGATILLDDVYEAVKFKQTIMAQLDQK